MEQKQHRKESVIHLIYRLVMIIFGAACAVAIELFLMPNKIIDGGIIGISLILDYLTPNIWWLSFLLWSLFSISHLCIRVISKSEKRSCYLRRSVL